MAYPDFYNVNAHRAYPFQRLDADIALTGGATWRDKWILDCGFTFSPEVGFDYDTDYVHLGSIERSGAIILFTFEIEGAAESTITFERTTSSPYGACEFVDIPDSGGVAFLVTGDLSDAASDLPDGTTVERSYPSPRLAIEPALVVTETSFEVAAIDVYNTEAARTPSPGGSISLPSSTAIHAVDLGLLGDIKVRPGHNMLLDISEPDNAITFTPSIGAGDGEPCGKIERYPGDPDDQGQVCANLLYTINGVPGVDGRFELLGGSGVYVTPIPAQNKIEVKLDITGQTQCSGADAAEEEE